jgi:hypothetical protein
MRYGRRDSGEMPDGDQQQQEGTMRRKATALREEKAEENAEENGRRREFDASCGLTFGARNRWLLVLLLMSCTFACQDAIRQSWNSG